MDDGFDSGNTEKDGMDSLTDEDKLSVYLDFKEWVTSIHDSEAIWIFNRFTCLYCTAVRNSQQISLQYILGKIQCDKVYYSSYINSIWGGLTALRKANILSGASLLDKIIKETA